MTEPAVRIDGLTKTFKGQARPALDGISAQIPPGRMTGLVGPDGAGKTTLMRLMAGLLAADAGEVAVKAPEGAGPAKTLNPELEPEKVHEFTGYMPQKFGLYEDLTVIENLTLYADLRGVAGERRRERFAALLAFTDLAPFQKRLAGRLSGGMKQKLGLACALMGDPALLLLDEPSVGVDPISRRELWRMVRELTSRGLAVVWSTAYLDEAEKCDAVILLHEGRKLFDGPPAELLKTVRGRTWLITGVEEKARRRVLLDLLKGGGVVDGVIQGRHIRVVTSGSADESAPGPDIPGGLREPAAPSFEDAFIEILGGGPRGESALAAEMAAKPDDGRQIIEAHGLTKKFGDFTAVADNSFQVRRGEVFGLLGPNGAGKSTTFKMMCGLLRPTAGRALVAGLDLQTAPSQARSRIGYMAQKFSLYDQLSVSQNLNFFSGAYGLHGRAQKSRIALMLDLFDLGQYRNASAGALPLGFKQRLALACAVMHEPDVLFLDEPTSGVDPITRREFWLHINAMVIKGVTVMVTTHFMDESEYCDRIGLIYRGRSIATGSPDELKALVRSPNLPDPTMEDAFVTLVRRSDLEGEDAG